MNKNILKASGALFLMLLSLPSNAEGLKQNPSTHAVEKVSPVQSSEPSVLSLGSARLRPAIDDEYYAMLTTIPYTGGNGAAYPVCYIESVGVTGLTARITGGRLSKSGRIVVSIMGIPSGSGVATFVINFCGKSTTLTVNVAPAN
jgi:hypothetical protein